MRWYPIYDMRCYRHVLYYFQGPEKCFPGFLMTFSWDFHNIAVHSELAPSGLLQLGFKRKK